MAFIINLAADFVTEGVYALYRTRMGMLPAILLTIATLILTVLAGLFVLYLALRFLA